LKRDVLHEDTVLGVRRASGGSWDYLLDADLRIAYVRLGTLRQSSIMDSDGANGTASELQDALTMLKRSGLEGLVLDLRDCPRGLIGQATYVAGTFLPLDTAIATVRYRQPRTPERYASHGGGFTQLPLVVLVGPDTSGAGELIACALQDNHRAPVIGQRTRGKDTIQPADNSTNSILIGETNHGLRLSTGLFTRPSGKNLGRLADSKPWDDWGVQPDEGFEVPLTPDVRRQIRRWQLAYNLRPADSREILPLDDLANDPVLLTGLKEIRRRIRGQAKAEPKAASLGAAR
jgi:carboxyl-terminal processing protease